MKTALLIAAVLTFAASAAFGYASDPTAVIWGYNFDNQATGISPAAMTDPGPPPGPPWNGDILSTNWQTVDDGGGNIILKKVGPGPGHWDYAWEQRQLELAGMEGQATQIFHMKLKCFSVPGGTSEAVWIGILGDAAGNCLGGWRIGGMGCNATVFIAGTHTNLYEKDWEYGYYPDQDWHDYDMVFTRATGQIYWYRDGVQVGDYLYAGMAGQDFQFLQLDSKDANTWIVGIDDIKVGTPIPEPSSLLAFGTFVIGALGYLRRRSA